ncbi:DNA polymerase I [Sarcina sp. DSM 11001]|uniref:DNA polymerase I n=1 Tax=Sarcina sp. DSM 11001 TaxID=1798184 RepID=UPI0008854440|nr:DNA polymerase I [Sarcina sp. DSM 11001]SDL03717.1 DNA polymerase I [Sarcina sp. DSM 11001]
MNTITGAGGSSAGKKLLLVDGHSILNRAFYGMPDLTNAKGVHTGAVYGFLNILFSQIDELQPDYLTVAFDVHAPTFRHEAYAEYKGTRKSMPEELREQVPLMKKMLTAMGIPICEQAGLEADDILGTLAKKAQAVDMDVVLLSGDRDLLQIATDRICIRIPRTRKGQTVIDDFREAQVLETYGVTPLQFIEVKALMGDASDNIPGVPKVGEKTATQLIREFGSVDGVYEHLDEVKKPALHKTLAENEDKARMSLFLAAIKTDCDVELDMEKAAAGGYYTKEAFELCTELGFKNILPRFDRDVVEETAGGFEPLEIVEEKALAQMKDTLLSEIRSGQEMVIGVWPVLDFPGYGMESPAVLTGVGISSSPAGAKSADGNWFIRTDGAGENNAAVLSFLKELRTAVRESSTASDSRETSAASDLKESSAASESKENTGSMLAVFGQKGHMFLWGIDAEAEFSEGIRMEGILDLLVGSYLVNPLKSDYEIEDVASEYLGISLQGAKSLFGKKTWARAFGEEPGAVISYACRAADAIRQAAPLVRSKLQDSGMWELYTQIERPLTFILSDMESLGIRIQPEALKAYSDSLGGRIDELEQQIYRETGETFNIASPKQLGEVLFEKMGLPGGKKTKTGYSTAAGVLEKLAPDYPVVNDILEYRGLTKLRSTYADGLMAYVADDRRIHTTLRQTITATGRISSTDPNLQNIPMKTDLGRQIRKAFIPREGYTFTDADYSQIELRILAHMSGDPGLIEAYRENEDIHRITASKVFHTPIDEVTPLQRRNAKAVNFGIVYGISSFGLSQGLSISRAEAAEYIKAYFKTYPGIKIFLDGLVSSAKKEGYAITMYGRRRPVPELSSSNFMQRSFGERVAMNSPIQGSAADIMKIAMIRVWERLEREKLQSRLILQIHDELLIETAPGEEETVRRILEEEMEHAADLSVRLETDVHSGADWYMAK